MGKLTTPRARVVLDDDTEHEVQIVNGDMVAFDRERARHRDWPTAEEGPMFWSTYLAWHALVRQGVLDCKLSEFETKALQVEMQTDDVEEVDPTQRAAAPE